MQKMRWHLKENGDKQTVIQLAAQLNNLPIVLANILVQRGITTFEEAKNFFRPELKRLHNPFLMKDMEAAVQRILTAEEKKEKVLIYGDYDVDGTSAVSLMCTFFKKLNISFDYYIPDRYTEGYGVSQQGVEYAKEHGFSLIIALDCGIKAHEKVKWAKENAIDFIICDHHLPSENLPEAIAVLDPKRKDCIYPYDELSGCGIGFKLCQAIAEKKQMNQAIVNDLLDFVAISIACDIVPITGENRILCFYGLEAINESPRPGIVALLSEEQLMNRITVMDLVFIVGPRINAAGRIEHGKYAVQLMTSEDLSVKEYSKRIHANNEERKDIDKAITAEALTMIGADEKLKTAYSTVVFQEDWHKGVIGIVASRLIETYYRPTVVLTESEGKISGSVRSVKGFDVHHALEQCKDCLDQFGGHKYAAGLTMQKSNVELFKKRFEEVVSTTITPSQRIPVLEIDAQLSFAEINDKFYRVMRQMAPFGPKNLTPVFATENVVDTGGTKRVGNDESHLRLVVKQNGVEFTGIAFGKGNYAERIKTGEPFAIAYSIDENHWKGTTTLQLRIKDIKFMDEQQL
tara:strand:+ start:50074 stop:51795 length:1722 start_codon:yes stop_codon:yes gene_type:complete